MLSFLSVWVGFCSFFMSLVMLFYRPAFTDANVVSVLYFGSPGALCFGGLILWAYRKEGPDDPALQAQRLQSKIGIGFALAAAAIVYMLIIYSGKLNDN